MTDLSADTETASDDALPDVPSQSPYFHALNAARYDRQALIQQYEKVTGRRLIVFIGIIDRATIAPFNDLLDDIQRNEPIDLLLATPGGDGEAAVRLTKLCHADCDDFRVVVPDEAKSAGTLFALGADAIVMSDSSDLGPIDPQIFLPARGEYVAAQGLLRTYNELEQKVTQAPDTYAWYASLLADIDAVVLTRAQSAVDRLPELVREALSSRMEDPSDELATRLATELSSPGTHEAIVDWKKAHALGLPVTHLDRHDDEWRLLWRLYVKYHALSPFYQHQILESRKASLTRGWLPPGDQPQASSGQPSE